MIKVPSSSALREFGARNASMTATYRELARRLPPGPVSKLTSSIAQMRTDLGKTIAEISSDRSISEAEVELEIGFDESASIGALGDPVPETKELLKKMADTEAADYELLAAIAGAVLPASSGAAERLAYEAQAARKRSTWAQDHLDLLNIS